MFGKLPPDQCAHSKPQQATLECASHKSGSAVVFPGVSTLTEPIAQVGQEDSEDQPAHQAAERANPEP